MSLWGMLIAQNGCGNTLGLDLSLFELNVESIMISSKISSKIKLQRAIGPHNQDILDFKTGSLLGDGHLEVHGNGARLCLQQEDSHKAYLLWSHKFLAERGYCNEAVPKI